ncbi:hypothetical protein FPV67DRAFT_1481796 [Lyophyllum atratum]|nr:hypothetical protein FPV67DRAFT_1481796 [Lyophyllum atratum]
MMRFIQVLCILVAVTAYGHQIPIQLSLKGTGGAPGDETEDTTWDLHRPPGVNSTGNLVFDTVNSLLQHWPNTRYRNGHTIVPGTIPLGTLLYHGTRVPNVPSVPEWLATDPEHSYMFCRGSSDVDESCWQFTFATTRPLKILYFDGTSAAKMEGGPMDSQDILAWGEVKPDWTYDEHRRINDLCDWGKGLGLDGFVRMEMDFEIMLCDFSNGLRTVSKLHLPSSQLEKLPPRNMSRPPMPIIPPIPRVLSTVLETGSWHNHYPGDPRFHLDLSRLVSFYDTALIPSLIPLRHGQARHEHRLEGISRTEAQTVQRIIADALTGVQAGSGVDWKTLFRVIALRYADRLELIHHLLNSTEAAMASRTPLESAKLTQQQLRITLTPYILHDALPPPANPQSHGEAANHSWASPVFKHCATSHTDFIASNPALSCRLTPSEQLLLGAVQETNKEICRVVVKMWAEGVVEDLDPDLPQPSSPSLDPGRLENLLNGWRADISGLMGWLDWSVWIKCRPACSFEEMCYLPTWPFFEKRPERRRPSPTESSEPSTPIDDTSDMVEDWLIPQPRCIRRVWPYSFP